ncbi:MFS transporter [Nocardia sp. MDA0666]|uniref:MFS transporter n=1 Tax=Nocardia sp. MDA0666 TaxID=2135448 RepID=UPI000D12EA37|nr:MFS transporter [Nocardia sp. MDA0666]PSR68848.1 MFS transporter [Nocardia sp. MDA0666]
MTPQQVSDPTATPRSHKSTSTVTVPRQAWLITAMLMIFMIINWADKTVLGLAAKPMMKDLGLTPEQYGLAASSFFFLFSVSTVVGGFLLVRVKTTWMLLAMALLWSVVQVPLAVTTSLGVIVVSRVILGVAEGPATPTALHAMMSWFPNHRRDVPNSFVMAGSALGLMVAAPLLSLVISHWGWRWAFGVLALTGLAWAACWLLVGREGPHSAVTGTTVAAVEDPRPTVSYRTLLGSGTWLSFAFACFAAYWTTSLLISWVPSYVETVIGLSTAQTGTLIAVTGAAGGLAMILQGMVSRALVSAGVGTRWARCGVAAVAVTLSGLFVLTFTLAAGGALQLVVLVLAFATGAPCLSAASAAVAEISPTRQRGAVLGVLFGVETSAGIIAPFVTGHLVGAATEPADGYHLAFGIGATMLVLAGITLALFARPDRDRMRISAHT